jgi:hypothetical protein
VLPSNWALKHENWLPSLTNPLPLDMVIKEIQKESGHLPWREVSGSLLPRLHLDITGLVALT